MSNGEMTNSDNYRIIEVSKNICACCGTIYVDFFDICDVCGWQNDPLQNKYSDYEGGANKMSLNEAKEAYRQGKEIY